MKEAAMEAPERQYRTQVLRWFVETGYVDGGGIGFWDSTKESVEVATQQEAEALRDQWLAEGKLIETHWGELRPAWSYGAFRIRSLWDDVPTSNLAARLAEVERERDRMESEAVVAMDRWHQSQARAERLEAALREIADKPWDYPEGPQAIARAALQQEGGE